MTKNRTQKICTNFLVSRNSFWIGFGSAMNIGGSYFPYNFSVSEVKADKRAIGCDWKIVGSDINKSVKEVNEAVQKKVGKQLEFDY